MMKWLRALEEILWPRGVKCLCCDEPSEGALLCPTCRKGLEAMRLSGGEAEGTFVRSVFRYDGVPRALVQLLKYECLEDAASVLAEAMAETMKTMDLPPETVLTWVTMPEQRRRTRGIDHGRALCEAISRASGFPVRRLLMRARKVHTQRGLSREERMRNLSGSFLCDGKLLGPVLLIDDVMTTGATASACAEVLQAAGASQVYVLTATRVGLQRAVGGRQEGDGDGFYPS